MEYFDIPDLIPNVNKIFLISFVIIYFFTNLTLLFKKNIKFGEESRNYEYFLMAFLFLLITNFQTWYIMWLFPLMMWQKKENIQLIIQISIVSQFANSVFLINGDGWRNGTPFTFFMVLGIYLWSLYNNRKLKIKSKY